MVIRGAWVGTQWAVALKMALTTPHCPIVPPLCLSPPTVTSFPSSSYIVSSFLLLHYCSSLTTSSFTCPFFLSFFFGTSFDKLRPPHINVVLLFLFQNPATLWNFDQHCHLSLMFFILQLFHSLFKLLICRQTSLVVFRSKFSILRSIMTESCRLRQNVKSTPDLRMHKMARG